MTEGTKYKIDKYLDEKFVFQEREVAEEAINYFRNIVWHDFKEPPIFPSMLFVVLKDGSKGVVPYLFQSPFLKDWLKWAYLDDILPEDIKANINDYDNTIST